MMQDKAKEIRSKFQNTVLWIVKYGIYPMQLSFPWEACAGQS